MSRISGPIRPQAWIDQHGELHEDLVPMVVWAKRRNGFQNGWCAMAQDAMDYLANEIRSVEDYRVLMLLMARLDFENLIQVPQMEIAENLGMKRPNVSRSMRRLVELGVLLEGPKIGRSKTYRLNPHIGWKGSARHHQKALREQMKQRGLSVIQGGGGEAPEPALERDENTIDWIDGGE